MVDSDIGFKEKSSYYDKSANFKTKKTIKVWWCIKKYAKKKQVEF